MTAHICQCRLRPHRDTQLRTPPPLQLVYEAPLVAYVCGDSRETIYDFWDNLLGEFAHGIPSLVLGVIPPFSVRSTSIIELINIREHKQRLWRLVLFAGLIDVQHEMGLAATPNKSHVALCVSRWQILWREIRQIIVIWLVAGMEADNNMQQLIEMSLMEWEGHWSGRSTSQTPECNT